MKKNIKSLLILLIIGCMLFALTGCGDKETTKKEDREEVIEQKQDIAEEQQSEVEFSMGEWNDNVYTNDFLGLKFNLPEGWTYSSDKELAKELNNGLELLNEDQRESVEKALETKGIYYLQAKDPATNNNVLVFTEKVPKGTSEEYYLQQVANQLSAIESVNYNIGQIGKENILNKEYFTLQEEIEEYGVLQKHYIYIKGDYVVGIIITSITGENVFDEVIREFE